MVYLKTDGGVMKVRLSEELAMIMLDPNGGKYNFRLEAGSYFEILFFTMFLI